MTIRYFLPVIALLATCCTPKEVEQAGPVEQEVAAHSITAYIDNGDGTRTGYVIDNEAKVARFNWLEKDLIDVTAWTGEAFTSVVFEAAAQGQSSEFSDGTVEGETTYAELLQTYPEADLADWAFYPSRADLGLKIDDQSTEWIIKPDTEITCILPSNLKANAENPLAVVPLMGLKDDAGDYAFKPATSVFGIPVKNLTPDMDFISLSHETAALCGAFRLVNGQLAQDTAYEAAGHEITISFSGIDGDFTFYFPIVGGSIPAGLTIRCGNSADPEGQMVLTTKVAFTLTNGRIGMCPALTFQPVDQLWEDYADAEYIDNLIWGYHESYTDGQTVPVKVERSGLFPEKYRFNNPYTVANELFGYTPYTDGIEGDDYFEFRIADGVLSYRNFVTGVEDKDANGHPMVLNYRSAYAGNTYVVSQLADGSPVELLFGCFYRATDDDTYFYTKDGSSNQQIHLYINQPEKWIEVAQGEFIDTFLWGSGYHNWGESRVPVTLQQNSADPALLRIPNPYLIAAEQFNYTPYSDGITGDEFIEITMLDEDLVRFKPFLAGIEDKASGGRPMKVWYPSDWIDDYDVSYNKVLSWRSDGLPAELQLAVVYSDPPISQGYMYTKNTLPSLHFYFPEPEETWVSVGTGRYTDEWFWKANAFPPYDVEVEIERSSMDPNRYRINNPYTVANSAFRRTPAGDADEYMYLQIDPESNVVSFGTLVTGMTRDKSGSIESNSGEVNWGIADTDASPAITGKSVEASRVIDGTASAPRTLQLYSAYYDSADYSYFYTASTGYKYLWFPAAYEAETWSSFCNGTYKDNIYDTKINGSSTLGTVTVDIQQSQPLHQARRLRQPERRRGRRLPLSAVRQRPGMVRHLPARPEDGQ